MYLYSISEFVLLIALKNNNIFRLFKSYSKDKKMTQEVEQKKKTIITRLMTRKVKNISDISLAYAILRKKKMQNSANEGN